MPCKRGTHVLPIRIRFACALARSVPNYTTIKRHKTRTVFSEAYSPSRESLVASDRGEQASPGNTTAVYSPINTSMRRAVKSGLVFAVALLEDSFPRCRASWPGEWVSSGIPLGIP
jgi:hypothetical protein